MHFTKFNRQLVEVEEEKLRAGHVATRMAELKGHLNTAFETTEELEAAAGILLPYHYLQGEPMQLIRKYVASALNCRFLLTKSGTIGMGPHESRLGDIVVILFGARSPFVLRPVEDGFYTLLGETYLDNVMQGQHIERLRERGELDQAKTVFQIR